ncbi:FAD/NAD(P)-dependent oxidoreductase [Pseudomonas putida]
MTITCITHGQDFADEYDVIVVGAGPAGACAATELSRAGARVLVLDENPAPGGQIYRAIGRYRPAGPDYLGKAYWAGKPIFEAFLASTLAYAPGARVWSLDAADAYGEPLPRVGVSLAGVARHLRASKVILATGAYERPMPIPGWTLPGVMTAGAAQIALKSADLVPSGKVVLAGSGPLLYQLALQLMEAGTHIEALLDTRAPWHKAWRHLPAFLCSPYALKGLAMVARVCAQTRVVHGAHALEVQGTDAAQRIQFRSAKGLEALEVDLVLLHQGVIPETALANSAGCAMHWHEPSRSFQPVLDEQWRSSLADVFIVGDGASVGGAVAAAEAGKAVAHGVAQALQLAVGTHQLRCWQQATRRCRHALRGRAFLDELFKPAPAFLAPPGAQTVVCRCEEVTVATVCAAARLGVAGPNQLKAFTRCGMGPCQGRQCAATVVELLAQEQGVSPGAQGPYRLRPPVKPLSLAEIAAMAGGAKGY